MLRTFRSVITRTALCAAAFAAMTTVSPASARPHRRILYVRIAGHPAHLRPGYVGAPGYVAGPPGPVIPMLIDFSFLSPPGSPLFPNY